MQAPDGADEGANMGGLAARQGIIVFILVQHSGDDRVILKIQNLFIFVPARDISTGGLVHQPADDRHYGTLAQLV